MIPTHEEFVLNWFKNHELEKFTNQELEVALRRDYESETGKTFADPTRTARKLHELGRLQRTPKGRTQYFWYESILDKPVTDSVFTEEETSALLETYDFKCSVCKKGASDGIRTTVGYAISLERGGKRDVSNGRVLCPRHRFILETSQNSDTSALNFRRLRKKLPQIGKASAKELKFWEDFYDLLERYGIDPTK
jgi:hypothetical protein